ncbi:MAG: PilZ domain-containing protein [Phycisphaeraceae bacterium]|nr:MAG: PilZ domain-containing protein [Phycisphaeraceae bacterium]
MRIHSERRRSIRFSMTPERARVVVRPLRTIEHDREIEGGAFDISEHGAQFELDQPLDPGTSIAMRIDLPHTGPERSTERRVFFVFAEVVWTRMTADGVARIGATFTRFEREAERSMLRRRLFSGRYTLAA